MYEQQAPRRAAIYARVSTLQQEDNSSLQTQEEGCRCAAPERGYTIDEAHVYRDIESGRLLYERPAVLALRDAIHRHAIDAVLVYDLDRLVRDQDFLAMLFGEANYAGVEIEFVTSRWDKTPEGTLLRNIAGYVAQKEHEKIRERMLRGLRARVAAGKILPGAKPLYGYAWTADRTAYVLDEQTAPIVHRIFERAAAGASLRSIARELTAAGIPTPSGGQTWGRSTIHAILTHPHYGGHPAAYHWETRPHKSLDQRTGQMRTVSTHQARPDAERIPLPLSTVPPLVDAALFEAVAARLEINKAQSTRNNHHPEETLLRCGFAICGICGANLTVTHSRGLGYRCLQKEPGNALYITAQQLDTAVWQAVRNVILDPTIIARELKKHQATPPKGDLARVEMRVRSIEREQQTLAKRLSQVSDAAAPPVIAELERLAAERLAAEQERDTLKAQIISWEARQDQATNIMAWCLSVEQRIDTFTYAERRNTLNALRVEARVYRQNHDPRFEVEMHIPLGGGQFQPIWLAYGADSVHNACV